MAFTTFSISNRLTPLKKYVHSANGMLVFNDEQAFTMVVDCLYACIQSLENENLSIDIDEYDYVLEQFENVMGHKSLRQYVGRKVNGLLAIDELTDENDPDECFFPDPVLRCLVNTEFELRIGGKIVSLRNVQNDYLAIKKDDNYVSPFVSFKTEQQMESALGSNCKTTGTSNGITITEFRLRPIIGYTNEIIIKAKLDGDCANIKNDFFRVTVEVTQPNGYTYSFDGFTSYPYFDGVIDFYQTEILQGGSGKYKICAVIEREGTSCKSAKVCCEFDVKEIKEQKPDCCKPTGKSEKDLPFNNGKSKMRTRLLIVNTFILPYSSISAKTKFYKKIGNKWKARKASRISVSIAGDYHQIYCNGLNKIVNTGIKERYNKKEVLLLKYTGILIFIKKDKMTSAHNMSGYSLGDNIRKIVSC
ncbi:MAG TPA: hypothetical protein PL084_08025 [Chitinophagales bacterium]|nr:hypothetical protein [Chitinophagales bacterium]HRP38457.1 hypothetical protein [Chitinophagales bacterium]